MTIAHPRHHIWGISDNGNVMEYGSNDSYQAINIWLLKKNYQHLSIYLELWAKTSKQLLYSKHPDVVQLGQLFESLSLGNQVDKETLQRASLGLLGLGPAKQMRTMQNLIKYFDIALTPQYQELLRVFDFAIESRDELVFNSIYPDLYLWKPALSDQSDSAIVVFPTKSNSLNMPRTMAHIILHKLDLPIFYVGQRPNAESQNGLLGMTYSESANFIRTMAAKHGIQKFYGLGTSLGGYLVCQMAQYMQFERILNFSGAQPKSLAEKNPLKNFCENFDHHKIISVLSKTDSIDQDIYKGYQKLKFESQVRWINSKTHGSFTAAFIEGELNSLLDWLVA